MPSNVRASDTVRDAVVLDGSGLVLGAGSRLIRFEPSTGRLEIAADRARCLALLSVVKRAPMDPNAVHHIEAAAACWDRGDKALANLRLLFAGLPRLRETGDAARLTAAEYLLDHGLTPRELLAELEIDPTPLGLEKYDPDQPRVPAGQGKDSGRWTDGIWDRVGHWLDEEVPVYDQDTGDVVGTRSCGSAIATNPLTIIGAGAAVLGAGEAAAAAAAATVADAATAAGSAAVPDNLTAYALRYLTTTGGRLGGAATRNQLFGIAEEYWQTDKYFRILGDGRAAEEYIPGPTGGTAGSTYVDLTAKAIDGTTVRVQTIDTLADGITPTRAEAAAAARIRAAYPDDKLTLIPKWPK